MDAAIRAARQIGTPLEIAAKVGALDQDHYRTVIALLIECDGAQFVGEVDQAAKNEFLGKASALLFPTYWSEQFGLVMIETMACSTRHRADLWAGQ